MAESLRASDGRKRQTQNISLRPVDKVALDYLAKLDAHENVSAAMRKLIAERMRAEIGRDWESELTGAESDALSLAS